MDILETYIHENPPPYWLVDAVKELAWIFREYPVTQAYFNTAMELTEMFTIDRMDHVSIEEIDEINYTNLPREKILTILEEALLIERKEDNVSPGPLVKKLMMIKWEGYEMNTPEVEGKLREIHGILTVALTRSMIRDRTYLPRRALAVFYLLSNKLIADGDVEITPFLEEYSIDIAMAKLTHRQRNRLLRVMSGFLDGETKIISDRPEGDGAPPLKDIMVVYLNKMRERWRTRDRELTRGSNN